MNELVKCEPKNEIVVYQPNETLRLEVLVENETVWLAQSQLCELFGVVKSNVSYHLKTLPSHPGVVLTEWGQTTFCGRDKLVFCFCFC